ncbi:MAG: transketolase family protein [Bacillales bacterium]|jgi:transketolase|nr:transketolase family protein [Bacillales bacterium]
MFENIEMRVVLGNLLKETLEKDKKVVVLDADLANANGTLKLRDSFPDRAFDVGVAEANMASMAAGMASYGYKPFITSFTPFATRRIADQIAISICYSNMNVKIIGTDPGISAEFNGGTHMSVEDIGILRGIPNIVIYEPVDAVQLFKSWDAILNYVGPLYIRLFRKDSKIIFKDDYKFDLFKADILKEGKDLTIFASGIMVEESLKAIEELKGIDIELINVHTIKPIDKETVIKSALKTKRVVIAENHNIINGLGSAILETLENNPVPSKRIGIPDRFGEVGKMPYLKEIMHMTKDDIIQAVKELMTSK